jgi:hypothetical protein
MRFVDNVASPQLWLEWGLALMHSGKHEEALDIFRKV